MLFLLCSLANAELHNPQAFLENVMFAESPPEGLDKIASVMSQIIPEQIEIPEEIQTSWPYVEFTKGWVNLSVTNAELTPMDGYLDLNIDLDIQINDPSDRFKLKYQLVFPSTCRGFVNTFPANVSGQVYMTLSDEDGDGVKEANVELSDTFTVSYDLTNDKITLENGSNCSVGTLDDIVGWFGGDLYEFILGFVPVDELLQDSLPELEETIEDAFNEANIEEQLELGDTMLNLKLSPNDISITSDGIRLAFNGQAVTDETADCVAAYDEGGSLKTDNAVNALADFPPGYDFGLIVTDDFLNQALYSGWRGGALCQTIDEEIFALDTSILTLITGDSLEHLFPESKPMIIETSPRKTLLINPQTNHDVAVNIEELGLDFITNVNGRQVRVLGMDLDTVVGLNLEINQTTGELVPEVVIDPAEVNATATHNEFAPTRSADIESTLVSQLDTILGLVDIDGLIADLQILLPTLPAGENALGLQDIDFDSSGAQNEDLGVYGSIGTVTYAGEGCSSDSDGSAIGCAVSPQGSTRPTGKTALLLGIGLLGLLRRRS